MARDKRRQNGSDLDVQRTRPDLAKRCRQTWAFLIAKALTDPIWWFFLIWLPDFFKQTRGLDIKTSWIHLVTIYTIVTVLSIGGGWVTGYLNFPTSSLGDFAHFWVTDSQERL